uniref:Uncharacterized protein n=1 Tax=viral metagenome TaxID=1070528 RepID=A0A6C0D3I7_9ZZZZ
MATIDLQSKNSVTAKSGFKAEEIFRTCPDIKSALETYFGKRIFSFDKIHGKKYDTKICFENGSFKNIQNKKIEKLGGRGDSFDRRHIKDTFRNSFIRKYLTVLTLIRKSKFKTEMSMCQKLDFIKLCNDNIHDMKDYIRKTLLGEEPEKNEFWCIMKTNKEFTNKEIYIISSETILDFIEKSVKIDIKLKSNGTCLHLSPHIALQRKGGSKTDHSPNHIQAKFKFTQEILDLCTRIL